MYRLQHYDLDHSLGIYYRRVSLAPAREFEVNANCINFGFPAEMRRPPSVMSFRQSHGAFVSGRPAFSVSLSFAPELPYFVPGEASACFVFSFLSLSSHSLWPIGVPHMLQGGQLSVMCSLYRPGSHILFPERSSPASSLAF